MSPGDIGFAYNRGLMAKLIRLGEWLKFRKCQWNHMFVVDRWEPDADPDNGGHWFIIQATIKGVTNTARLEDVAPGGRYTVIGPPQGVSAADVLFFARSQVGTQYSILTILAIALDIVSWNWVPAFANSRKRSWICSSLTCEALRFGGWFFNWVNVYTVTPQQAFDALSSN
jgi:hypothetical protein